MSEEEDLKIFAEDMLDFLNAMESACVKLKMQIDKLLGPEPGWDPSKIKWTEAEGIKGKYERSEDVNSLDFKALLKDLEAHNGKLTRDGFFYWKFSKSGVIGRKKRK